MANKTQQIQMVHIDFINKKIRQHPIFIDTQVAYANTAECLGMTLDVKLQWKEDMKKKVMSSTSSSGKCADCLEAILSCQSTINSYHTSKLYIQFELRHPALGLHQ
jgi:hypothetical protein